MLIFCFIISLITSFLFGLTFGRITCSGHGVSVNSSSGLCKCFPGFTGFDCSLRLCPAGVAWVDFPHGSNAAHSDFSECSNMGKCDRSTGICNCRSGFSGPSCDILLCPNGTASTGNVQPCSGNGRCMSLRESSEYENAINFPNRTTYSDWDADKIHGCVCDAGWEGVSCNRRSCPKGDDPLTIGLQAVQLLDCKCSSCGGSLRLRFGGKETPSIPYDATAALIRYRLLELPGIEDIQVSFLRGLSMCSAAGSITKILFRLPQGDPSAITHVPISPLNGSIGIRAHGESSHIIPSFTSTRGTTEYVECSNRGICDFRTGSCLCLKGFGSSDGRGNRGDRGDCGYQDSPVITQILVNSTVAINTTCPYIKGFNTSANSSRAFCSGHGACNHTTGVCSCDSGYGGAGCAFRSCGYARSWFGNMDTGHSEYSLCAGVGDCDYDTGVCKNCGGGWGVFSGVSCERFACSSNAKGTCSGEGVCLSLRDLAEVTYNDQKELAGYSYTTPWDADMIYGCACLRAFNVDNQFRNIEKGKYTNVGEEFGNFSYASEHFYRGPQAFSATGFSGYDCNSALCPKGHNPLAGSGLNEIQLLRCRANNGTFRFEFRGNYSDAIPYNSTKEDLHQYLNNIDTIHNVLVTMDGANSTICDAYGRTNVYIEFVWEFGDLPLLRVDTTYLQDTTMPLLEHHYLVNVTEYQKGTKQELECSGMGLCNENTGRCDCAVGFQSSNGYISEAGERGDCAHYNKYYTVNYDGTLTDLK